MAGLTRKDVSKILKEHPLQAHIPFCITDQDTFILRLEEIRDQNNDLEKEETVEGVMGIAVHIRDYTRQVAAALGIAFPLGLAQYD